mmetsp:Transcript_11708/g.19878  ORF Transcript_11708/g.19878 Transcript_11708/m.19878 type:complete len:221 (+) Transcript_11708:201-863(+)
MSGAASCSDALRLLKKKSIPARAINSSPTVAPPPPPPLPMDENSRAEIGVFLPPTISEERTRVRSVLRWGCDECGRECVPIRDESRCMCGHRLREHVKPEEGKNKTSAVGPTLSCKNRNCKCKSFFYIVAEGAWILRCRCKHKHVEHDPVTHACTKPTCECSKFSSPWVCNCNHPWTSHSQAVVQKEVRTIAGMMMGSDEGGLASDVNRWDELKRGDWET